MRVTSKQIRLIPGLTDQQRAHLLAEAKQKFLESRGFRRSVVMALEHEMKNILSLTARKNIVAWLERNKSIGKSDSGSTKNRRIVRASIRKPMLKVPSPPLH